MSIKRHTAYNLVGALLPLAVVIATVPLYIETIGEARYGVLALAWLLLGYFGVFDLGLGAAVAQRVAALEGGSKQERADVFRTGLAVNLGFGLLGGLILWPVALYVAQSLRLEASLRAELIHAIPWLIIAVPIATASGVISGSLQGISRFLELNIATTTSSVLGQLLPLGMALYYSRELHLLILGVVLARLFTVIIMYVLCNAYFSAEHRTRILKVNVSSLMKFGGWVTISSIISPLMFVLDRMAIGSVVGVKAVAQYTVPYQVAERMIVLPAALASALFPRLASPSTMAERQTMLSAATRAVSSAMTPLATAGVLLINPFLAIWINVDFATHSGLSAQVLILAFWTNSLVYVPAYQLRAIGRPDIVAKCHLAEILPYITLLYLGLERFGIVGAALVFLIRTAFECIIFLRLLGVYRRDAIILVKKFIFLLTVFGFANIISVGGFTWWAGVAGLLGWSLISSWKSAPEPVRIQAQATFDQLVRRSIP